MTSTVVKTKHLGKEYLSKQLAPSFLLMTDVSFSPEDQIELFKFILFIHLLLNCDNLWDKARKLPIGLYIATYHSLQMLCPKQVRDYHSCASYISF